MYKEGDHWNIWNIIQTHLKHRFQANHGVTVRKESMNTDISPDPSFWGTATSLPTRTTPVNGSLKGSLVAVSAFLCQSFLNMIYVICWFLV